MSRVATLGLSVSVLLIAGFGFVYKMTEFALTIVKDDVEGFGAVAIAIYLIGMLPLVFLTLWAVLTGRFRDIERPKYRMLELNADLMDGAPAAPSWRRAAPAPPRPRAPTKRSTPSATTPTRATRCRGG
jgi:nitrogen fixation-related uncharacterized protein